MRQSQIHFFNFFKSFNKHRISIERAEKTQKKKKKNDILYINACNNYN
jgi:hypothetical protein